MRNHQQKKEDKRQLRRRKVHAKIQGTAKVPRLNVFRSLKHIKVQLIDDIKGNTLIYASDNELQGKQESKIEIAKEVGKLIAQKARNKKITKCVFDRAGYRYHGRVKAVAEGAREGGLRF